jgi:hypothetical protein
MLQAGTREEALVDVMNGQQLEREEQRAQASRGELIEGIARAIHDDGTDTPLEGLMLRRATAPMELGYSVSYPSLCVIAQGSKLIHRSAWKGNSRKFAFTEFSEVRPQN